MLAHHAFDYIKTALSNYDGNYFEIGVYEGDAIANLAKEFTNKQVFAVDPFIEDGYTNWLTKVDKNKPLNLQRERTYQNIDGISNVKLFETTSQDFVNNLTHEQIKAYNINMVFIDGSHHYEDVMEDWILALRLLNGGPGEIIFDDTNLEGVEKAIEEFHDANKEKITETHIIEPNCTVFKLNSL